MKLTEFCERIKGVSMSYFNNLPVDVQRQWKEELNEVNKGIQLKDNPVASFKRLYDSGKFPTKSSHSNVYSLFAGKTQTLMPSECRKIGTGVTVEINSDDHVLLLGTNCNLAWRCIGMINSGDFLTASHCNEEIEIYLINFGASSYTIEEGSCIAKATIIKTGSIQI